MPHIKSDTGWLSVTEVLSLSIPKPFLFYWYGKNGTEKCEQIKRESQEIGTEVHRLIEDRFKNGEASTSSMGRCIDMEINFWAHFVVPYEVKPIVLENTYKDEKLKLQGTLDAVIDTNKWTNVVADWKTSNSLDKITVPLQLSAYDHLCNGSGKGVAVRIDKEKDKIEVVWYDNLKKYWPIFKACLKVAKYTKFGV